MAVMVSASKRPELSGAPFEQSLERLLDTLGVDTAMLGQRAGMETRALDDLLTGDSTPSPMTIELISNALGVSPSYFLEYRLAKVTASIERDPSRVNDLFLASMSDAERDLVDVSAFDNRQLRDVLRSLLKEEGLTQGELAESIGLGPTDFSLIVNSRAAMPPDFVESVAQALGRQPEFFLSYRLEVAATWLESSPSEIDSLWAEMTRGVELAPYHEWPMRELPDPRAISLVDLAKSLIEIVGAEGPVLGARVYATRLRAAHIESETRELRSLLNRASHAATRARAVVAVNERYQPTQRFLVLRIPDTPEIRVRERGNRAIAEIPLSEVAAVITSTEAYRFGHSLEAVQNEVLAAYRVTSPRLADMEHINRAINLRGSR